MDITVTLKIKIEDPKQWTTTFGVEGAREIRADVKSYVGNGVQGLGVFGDGEVDAEITWK